MRPFNPLGRLIGFAMTAAFAAVVWFAVVPGIRDRIEDIGGGGPFGERIVSAERFTPVAAQLRKAAGSEASIASVTVRPSSVEMVAVTAGRARGYRWRNGHDDLQTFEVGASGEVGRVRTKPFSMRKLDPRALERMSRAISAREGGDFRLSIADLERAETGKIVWIVRGMVGERGIAWFAGSNGRRVKPYSPVDPDLSRSARRVQCTSRADNKAAKVKRCLERFPP